mmetsp:Transcript_14143/g.59096  ORF Transcript_14143/g.59096 Transcript_14143/m.59096 type:complete len:283 (-) Transcript_14143:1066-1914(-)
MHPLPSTHSCPPSAPPTPREQASPDWRFRRWRRWSARGSPSCGSCHLRATCPCASPRGSPTLGLKSMHSCCSRRSSAPPRLALRMHRRSAKRWNAQRRCSVAAARARARRCASPSSQPRGMRRWRAQRRANSLGRSPMTLKGSLAPPLARWGPRSASSSGWWMCMSSRTCAARWCTSSAGWQTCCSRKIARRAAQPRWTVWSQARRSGCCAACRGWSQGACPPTKARMCALLPLRMVTRRWVPRGARWWEWCSATTCRTSATSLCVQGRRESSRPHARMVAA